jgi:NAD(P)-dependent dehydrogenase (short-subunit alcohol dehydrogenase family)
MSIPTHYDLSGRVAVVTGAARGIGHATVQLLRERGAQIVASDRSDAVHERAGDDVATIVGDVSDEQLATDTVGLAVERFGRLDILVNNAGRTLNKLVIDTSVEEFDEILAINARGNFLHAREAFKVMDDGGAIVTVGSVSSVVAFETQVAYAASDADHPRAGDRGRQARHPRELRAARRHRHRHHGGRRRQRPGDVGQLRRRAPDRPDRPPRGSRRGNRVPRIRRRELHHRRTAAYRRRLDRPVAMSPAKDIATGPLFVVGAGPGVGAAVARRFGREGHPAGLVARDRDRLYAMTRQLGEEGIEAAFAIADARDPDAVRSAVAALQQRLGPAEVLCVSPLPDVATMKPLVDTTAEDLRAALELGLVGTAAAVGQVVPAMRAAGRGTLLFTTGSAALTPRPERASSGIVNAAQATYFRMLHDQLANDGIYALHTVIVGPIGDNGHDPADIAQAMWEAARQRTDPQIVIR